MNKTLIGLLIFGFSFAQASEECKVMKSQSIVTATQEISTDVPNYLKGATITVRLADGKESTVPAEKFKVVPRKQQFLVTATEKNTELSCKDIDRHRVSAVVGHGPNEGIDRDNSQAPSQVELQSKTGVVGGFQYQYKSDVKLFDKSLSVGGQVQSNKTGSVLLGLDF